MTNRIKECIEKNMNTAVEVNDVKPLTISEFHSYIRGVAFESQHKLLSVLVEEVEGKKIESNYAIMLNDYRRGYQKALDDVLALIKGGRRNSV